MAISVDEISECKKLIFGLLPFRTNDPTQPIKKNLDPTQFQPNLTRGLTQPMDNSDVTHLNSVTIWPITVPIFTCGQHYMYFHFCFCHVESVNVTRWWTADYLLDSCDESFRFNDGYLTIREDGLYFLYAQVHNNTTPCLVHLFPSENTDSSDTSISLIWNALNALVIL